MACSLQPGQGPGWHDDLIAEDEEPGKWAGGREKLREQAGHDFSLTVLKNKTTQMLFCHRKIDYKSLCVQCVHGWFWRIITCEMEKVKFRLWLGLVSGILSQMTWLRDSFLSCLNLCDDLLVTIAVDRSMRGW